MRIGVPKEIKSQEYRVGLLPGSVRELVRTGHEVIVEADAGKGIGFCNDAYVSVGAEIEPDANAVFAKAELIVKVKEPQPVEIARLRPGQVLFTYLHLAADRAQAEGLIASGAVCIAYETVTDSNGRRMSVQVGARYLEKSEGGRGLLLGGVPGTSPAQVTILGGGVSGTNAARMAIGEGEVDAVMTHGLHARDDEVGRDLGRAAVQPKPLSRRGAAMPAQEAGLEDRTMPIVPSKLERSTSILQAILY